MSESVYGMELRDPPSDGISNLVFSNQSNNLLVSSWDSSVRLYSATAAGSLLASFSHHRAAALDCCFLSDQAGVSGSIDKTVGRIDFTSGRVELLGQHEAAVRCVEYSQGTGLVISGGWDRQLLCWDPKAAPGPQRRAQASSLPERVYSMSLSENRLVVAMAGRHVFVYDLRNMREPEQKRESSLKFQTRSVRCFLDGSGFALGSVEGRVAMEFFDPSEAAQAKKYAFKCHRRSDGQRDIVYPVNAIAFHPIFGTFATGGCDGVINVWDGTNKKRLYQYPKYPTSIAALSFSHDGQLLAVASSYTFEMGDVPHEKDTIFVRSVNEIEVKPKLKVPPP